LSSRDITPVHSVIVSRGSSVGIVTVYGLDDEGSEFESRYGQNFLFSKFSRPALLLKQPPSQWVPGALSPGGKATGA
jgi:hypothetical protein